MENSNPNTESPACAKPLLGAGPATPLTEQEAALYLNRRCRFRQSHWADPSFEYGNLTPEILINISKDSFVCQLILRPLSAITEEEAIESGLFQKPTSYSQTTFDEFSKGFNKPVFFGLLEWTPKSVKYLLSRGFDLFGFIEQGKAIDITLSQPKK